jgi:hypothetical protein
MLFIIHTYLSFWSTFIKVAMTNEAYLYDAQQVYPKCGGTQYDYNPSLLLPSWIEGNMCHGQLA